MRTRSRQSLLLRVLLAITLLTAILPLPAMAADAGFALAFDGVNDFVTLAATPSMIGPTWNTTKTVSLWVQPEGAGDVCAGSESCDAIFGDRPRYWGISRGVRSGADRLWVWNYDGTSDVIGVDYTAGEWVHITLVHSGGMLRAYKNGVEVGAVASGTTLQASTTPMLHLGGIISSTTKNWSFRGQIDEVQIWNVARTAAEIQQDMTRVLAENEPGLAAYYRMSNGAGLALTDDSIYTWNGTLYDGGNGVPPNGAPPLWVLSGAFGGSNSSPIAVNDEANTNAGVAVSVAVLGNDSDPDNNPLSVTAAGPAANGAVTTDGVTVTYTPNPGFTGADSFPYTISDGNGGTASAQVTVTVVAPNNAPLAANDAATTDEDAAVSVAVLGNDSDPDNDPLSVTAAGPAANGVVTTNGVTVTYTPALNFNGVDSFSYTVGDGKGGVATAQVTVTVLAVNDAPIAGNDAATTNAGVAVSIAVLGNDSDPDNNPLTVTAAGPAVNGVVTTDGVTVTYTPNASFIGVDSFPYTIGDGAGGTASAQVTVTVVALNNAPLAANDAATTDEDAAVSVAVLGNDSDPDNDPLAVTAAGPAANGVVTTNGVTVTYTPALNFNGVDSFSYTVGDGKGGVATAQVTVTVLPVNDAPLATNDAATTDAGVAVNVAVLGNDGDPDGDALTVTAAGPAANGVVTTDGVTVTYTPNAGFGGVDSFPYTIGDGAGGAAAATVTVTVTGLSAGYALSFDGANDFVVLSATASMLAPTWTTTKTVSLWVKPNGAGDVCTYADPEWCDAIFGDRPRWWGIARGIRSGQDKIWVFNFDGNSDSVGVDYTPGEWVHITLMHSGGVLRAYKNGIEVGSTPSGPTQQPPAKPVLQIGGVINNVNRNWTFRGEIDEVQIWNVARSTAEVQADMRRTLVGDEAGLAAYYRMSNGSGTVLTDDSIYNWNGVLYDGGNGVAPNGTLPQWVTSGAFDIPAR